MPIETSLAKKVTRFQNSNDCFLAPLGNGFFMNKFRKLGYIEYNGKLEIRNSLLNVVLYDKPEIGKHDASNGPR